eukprot:7839780-Prorocentrum_lima.AAC.1
MPKTTSPRGKSFLPPLPNIKSTKRQQGCSKTLLNQWLRKVDHLSTSPNQARPSQNLSQHGYG